MTTDIEKFTRRHTELDKIPSESIEAGKNQLSQSDLYRYHSNESFASITSMFEQDFANYVGSKYALAVNSCGSALLIALKSLGVSQNDQVVTQAYTFTAVPSAIALSGANTILAEIDDDYCIDTDDLKRLLSPDISAVIVSHMKGHIGKMDEIHTLCKQRKIPLIEDAAHALGCFWGDKPIGSIGDIGCFSFQSSKIINGGEGGMLVTDNPEIFAKALLYSGAFQDSYKKHLIDDQVISFIEKYKNRLPMFSMRMSNLTASIIRPQLSYVERKTSKYLENYKRLIGILINRSDIILPKVEPKVTPAPDAIQFQLYDSSEKVASLFVQLLSDRGVTAHMTGRVPDNVRVFWNWKYIENSSALTKTQSIINNTCDIRLPYRFDTDDIDHIGKSILWALEQLEQKIQECA